MMWIKNQARRLRIPEDAILQMLFYAFKDRMATRKAKKEIEALNPESVKEWTSNKEERR
jgi:hypothetical protein